MIDQKGSPEDLRLEYSEANNNWRHYSNLRFAVLTVFFAVIGGIGSVAFGVVEIKSPSSLNVIRSARIAGLIFTVIFFFIEIVCDSEFRYFRAVAKDIRNKLPGYHEFPKRKMGYFSFKKEEVGNIPKRPYVTWLMYTALIVFWVYSIFRP